MDILYDACPNAIHAKYIYCVCNCDRNCDCHCDIYSVALTIIMVVTLIAAVFTRGGTVQKVHGSVRTLVWTLLFGTISARPTVQEDEERCVHVRVLAL